MWCELCTGALSGTPAQLFLSLTIPSPLPGREDCPSANGTLSLFPLVFFRALAIIEKSKSTDLSVVFIAGVGVASRELMPPRRLQKSRWGLCGSELSRSCQGDPRWWQREDRQIRSLKVPGTVGAEAPSTGPVLSRLTGSVRCSVRWNPTGRGWARTRLGWPLRGRCGERATSKLKLVLAVGTLGSHLIKGPAPNPHECDTVSELRVAPPSPCTWTSSGLPWPVLNHRVLRD